MNTFVLGREAEADINDLWDYVADDSVDAADRIVAALFDAFEELAQFPAMGHKREDVTTLAVRFWPVGNYLIVYRPESDPIQVVAVVHGKRDVPSFLRQRGQG